MAESTSLEQLSAENAALRAELERMRARYETPVEPPVRSKKKTATKEPERFALVGPGPRKTGETGPPEKLWDAVGEMLCRLLGERRPGTRWSYYRDQRLVPEGMTFFYAHEVLRKMWGEGPGNPDPSEPQAYRRPTAAEQDKRDSLLQAALHYVDETLERSQTLQAEGYEVAAVGLLKYVDLLLARFNLALARAGAGDIDWPNGLHDPERDAELEAWVAAQVTAAA